MQTKNQGMQTCETVPLAQVLAHTAILHYLSTLKCLGIKLLVHCWPWQSCCKSCLMLLYQSDCEEGHKTAEMWLLTTRMYFTTGMCLIVRRTIKGMSCTSRAAAKFKNGRTAVQSIQVPVGCQIRLGEQLSQQHAIRHVLDNSVVAGVVLKANAVAHLTPQLVAHLLRHPLGHTHGSHPSGLGAPHPANLGVPLFMQILGYLHAGTAL